jgi:hypothetical protein
MTDLQEAPAPAVPHLRRKGAERAAAALLPACIGVWTAAEIMHAVHVAPLDIGLGTAALAGLAYGKDSRSAATGLLLAGLWSAAAAKFGPLADPGLYYPLTGAWAVLTFCGWRWVRRHPAVVAAREKRNAAADWLDRRSRWGLHRTHLLDFEPTRLGERYVIDTRGTGKRASAIERSDTAERIAEDEMLPVSRVRVTRHRLAGRVEISIRRTDPWARPIPHPVLDGDPEIDLSGPYSARRPAVIGQDPETGDPLELLLCDEKGGRNVSVVGIKGAGKTVMLSDISERVTAASDALLIRLNLSIKGDAEASMWAPACHLTALGRSQRTRALKVLRVINGIIEWRSQQPRLTADFIPSRGNPLLVLIIDEVDAAAEIPAIRAELKQIASKGREFGVSVVRAGQRGTADWTGGADIRSQDDVFCLGMVNRSSEAMHAAGDLGLSMPDMASYGEGRPGVWMVAELGAGHRAGRTFNLKEPADISRIVAERARSQPDLQPELRAFLGKSYEELLSTDVFARWARSSQDGRPVTAHPRPDMPEPGPAKAAAVPVPVLTGDPLAAYEREAEDALPDELRARWLRQGERLDETRRILEETAKADLPDIPHEQQVAYAEAQWKALGEETVIPADHQEPMLRLLAAGTTISEVAGTLGVTKWTARTYLERLRGEGRVRIEGEKRTARWLLSEPREGDAS